MYLVKVLGSKSVIGGAKKLAQKQHLYRQNVKMDPLCESTFIIGCKLT